MTAAAEAGFVAKSLTLARKDLRVELRARDTLPPMLAFSLAVTLLLAFTLPGGGRAGAPVRLPFGTVALVDVLAGYLWVTVLFAGLVGFARTFEVERADGAVDALLLVPLDRSGLWLAKALANLAFVAAVQALLLPAFGLLFGLEVARAAPELLLVVALVDVGFVAVGTLFASVAAQTTSRELMLPILALPALVPPFVGAFELTSTALSSGGFGGAAGWLGLLVVFDVVFVTVGVLAFEFVVE
ncbi:MAG TPA: heme exporter protein CcmB [Actinomycetota bacterium]|nr:heme exporter protein CcmB [Actinomycetota bacterium]